MRSSAKHSLLILLTASSLAITASACSSDPAPGSSPGGCAGGKCDDSDDDPGAGKTDFLSEARHDVISTGEVFRAIGAEVQSGDFNGDGADDVAIVGQGAVYVHLSDAGRIPIKAARTLTDFSYPNIAVLDLNKDGHDDLVVGDNGRHSTDEVGPGTLLYVGRLSVYLGTSFGIGATPEKIIDGKLQYQELGRIISRAGDVDGDGFEDLAVEAREGPEFVVHLYTGGAGGMSDAPLSTVRGDDQAAWFGYAIASAGDVNDDGHADVLVGDPDTCDGGSECSNGRATLFLGGPQGLDEDAAWTFGGGDSKGVGLTWNAHVGGAVTSLGDIDGDGRDDVAIGAYGFDVPGLPGAGAVFVFRGTASGLADEPSWTLFGQTEEARLGTALAADDVDGDGRDDLVVGSFGYDPEFGDAQGAIDLFLGGGADGLSRHAAFHGDGLAYNLAFGDVNEDGHADLVFGYPDSGGWTYRFGRVDIYRGGAGVPVPPEGPPDDSFSSFPVAVQARTHSHFSPDGRCVIDQTDFRVFYTDDLESGTEVTLHHGFGGRAESGDLRWQNIADVVAKPGPYGHVAVTSANPLELPFALEHLDMAFRIVEPDGTERWDNGTAGGTGVSFYQMKAPRPRCAIVPAYKTVYGTIAY